MDLRTSKFGINLKRILSDLFEIFPWFYLSIMRLKHSGRDSRNWLVGKETDLVIEGMQRSANSFAIRAFRAASEENRAKRLATHIHSPAQVIAGCRRGLPVMVLIREPDQLVPSLMAWAEQLNKAALKGAREKELLQQICYWTRRYVEFHSRLMPFSEKFVTVPFGEVVTDFGACIASLNERFGTDYDIFEHTPENVEAIRKGSAVHVLPSAERTQMKEKYEQFYHSPVNQKNRERANDVYRRFLAASK